MLLKQKQNLEQDLTIKRARFSNQKIAHRIDDWQFTLIENCERHKQLKERETIWQPRVKTFYPYEPNEKKEYLY